MKVCIRAAVFSYSPEQSGVFFYDHMHVGKGGFVYG